VGARFRGSARAQWLASRAQWLASRAPVRMAWRVAGARDSTTGLTSAHGDTVVWLCVSQVGARVAKFAQDCALLRNWLAFLALMACR